MARPSDWSPLGLDSDPTPGDPAEVRRLADELQEFADDVGEALGRIRSMASDRAVQEWAGLSADAFRAEFDGVPGNLTKLRDSYDLCARALQGYWPQLETAQGQADRALERAVAAQADLTAARGALGDAQDWVSRAGDEADRLQREGGREGAPPPDEDAVRAATRDRQAADEARGAAQARVDSAESALAAARELAEQARQLREEAARQAARDIDEASDAGIQNRSWWENLVRWVTDAWDTLVEICKVIVAVLGVIALIIGGPIAWVVLAAAVVVLADTLIRFARGEGSLLDVAFAALDCIPGMRGLTTLGGLVRGLRGGLAAARTGLRGLALGARGIGQNIRRMGRNIRGLALCGDPVDMATGELIMSATDVDLPGVLPLVLERHHRTSVRGGLLYGPSWAGTLDQRLVLSEHEARLHTADGMVLRYPVPSPHSGVLPVEGPHWPLGWDGDPGGEMTVRQHDTGLTLHFRPVPGRPPSTLPLTGVSDRNGNAFTLTHDATGLPAEITHHGGYRIGVTCESGRITRLTLLSAPDAPTLVSYGYDIAGNLAEITNSSGLPLRLRYDARHRLTGWEDRNGTRYRYTYDDADRCVATHGTDGILAYTFAYDTAALTTTAVDSLGHTRRYQFNDCYQLVAETDPLGHTVRQEWDRRDNLLTRTDELGHTTRLTWDAAGNLTAVELPDGATTRARHNDLGLPVEVTDFDGAVRRTEWDERGNCLALTEPTGATTRFTRDPSGALAALTDATGATTRFTNNAAGLPVRCLDPLDRATHIAYDAFGRPASVTDPLGAVTLHTWTPEGHPASRTHPDGATETWTYDAEGNRLAHTDVLGRTTRWTYGPFDQPATRTTPDGVTVAFTHDTEQRLVRVTDQRGLTWDYTYDALGSPTSETDYDGRTVHYTYDAAGQLTSRTNAAGQTVAYAYDSAGRLTGTTSDGAATTYTNDRSGRILTATGPDVALAFAYDAAGRTVAETIDGRTLHTVHDALGRPAERTTPAGVTARYAYDAAGQRVSVGVAGRVLTSAYDPAGREERRALGGGPVLAHTWDAADRLVRRTVTAPDPAARTALRRDYRYRADDTVAAVDDTAIGERMVTTDPAGRVTAVRAADWTETYAWDPAGDQTRATWAPGHADADDAQGDRAYDGTRVTGAGGLTYEYDAAGRVTVRRRKRLSRKPDVWRYTWDAEDRLTTVTTPDGTVWRYLYDALGRRVAKRRLAPDGSVAEEIRFTWDGTDLVEQTTTVQGDAEAVTLTWERDGTHPVAQTERRHLADAPQSVIDERFFAVVTDLIGTPTELVDEQGRIAWRAVATLWGLTAAAPDSTTDTPLRFPGQYADPETQLHYNVLRHYDPFTARYVTPDPLGMDAGPNPRAYVVDPLTWFDYLGLLTCAQNAAILRRNLAAEGRVVGPGQAAAHIVPSGFNRGGAPAMRALLRRYNIDINDAANGIPLGHPTPHNFTHTNRFLARLDRRLQHIERIGRLRGMGAGAIRASIRRELRRVGRQVERELSTGAPGPGAYWTV